jgi:hypothetical protein
MSPLLLFLGLLFAMPTFAQTIIHRDTKVSTPVVAPPIAELHDAYQPLVAFDETEFGLEKLRTDSRIVELNGLHYSLPGIWKPIDRFMPGTYAKVYLDLVHQRDSFRHLSEHLQAQSIPLSKALHDYDSVKIANDSLTAAIGRPQEVPVIPDTSPGSFESPPLSSGAFLFIGAMAVVWLFTPAFLPIPSAG